MTYDEVEEYIINEVNKLINDWCWGTLVMNYYLESDILILELGKEISNILRENNIVMIKDLWKLRRDNLKKYNLNDSQINDIIIKMQLLGLDLGGKIYSRN